MVILYRSLQGLWISDYIIIALGAWVISIILMILNLQIMEILEGALHFPNFFLHQQQKKFNYLDGKINQIQNIRVNYEALKDEEKTKEKLIELMDKNGLQISELEITSKSLEIIEKEELWERIVSKLIEVSYELRTKYPKEYSRLLPTSFGNIISSFKSYPIYAYNIDAIAFWSRIMHFASENHKKSINDNKAQLDFTVNLCFVWLILFIEYIIFSVITRFCPTIWIPVTLLIFTLLSYKLSLRLAISWGEDIKAVFDLYRYDFLKQMNVDSTKVTEETWKKIDWLFLYWVPLEDKSKDKSNDTK